MQLLFDINGVAFGCMRARVIRVISETVAKQCKIEWHNLITNL